MKKLLIVCGPTSTGKTKLALHLAKKFNGELVSADSRQVYRWMNVGTGKDVPEGFEFRISNFEFRDAEVGYYTNGNIHIWGYDLVEPTEEFSVGQYVVIAHKIIENIHERNKLPILVGGSGLYIKGVVDGIPTASIPKNKKLRKTLEEKKASELFEILAQLDPTKAAKMNISDRENPRRLIRAIEVADWRIRFGDNKHESLLGLGEKVSLLFIGLFAPQKLLHKNIAKRVKKRLSQGIEREIRALFKKGVSWKNQSMNSLGYKQWRSFFKGTEKKARVIKKWEQDEKRYAKRQVAWFKKDKRINWFDISKRNWKENVEKRVNKWYKNSKSINAGES